MNPQTRDVIVASLIGSLGLLACMTGAAWACVGAINLFKKENR